MRYLFILMYFEVTPIVFYTLKSQIITAVVKDEQLYRLGILVYNFD